MDQNPSGSKDVWDSNAHVLALVGQSGEAEWPNESAFGAGLILRLFIARDPNGSSFPGLNTSRFQGAREGHPPRLLADVSKPQPGDLFEVRSVAREQAELVLDRRRRDEGIR
jgi:hypothetical protein